jgi:hypothetical protein
MDNQFDNLLKGICRVYPESIFLKNLRKAIHVHPSIAREDFLSGGQVLSKRWLASELKKLQIELGLIYLTPGWYGLMAQFISEEKLNFAVIRSFDRDLKAVEVSELLNHDLVIDGWKFKATCLNVLHINYERHEYITIKNGFKSSIQTESPDTIINTACEHFDYQKWLEMIPAGKLVVLQNNDFLSGKAHTHCVSSLEEFVEKCGLSEIYYSGVLNLTNYNRYMLIGRK